MDDEHWHFELHADGHVVVQGDAQDRDDLAGKVAHYAMVFGQDRKVEASIWFGQKSKLATPLMHQSRAAAARSKTWSTAKQDYAARAGALDARTALELASDRDQWFADTVTCPHCAGHGRIPKS